MKFKIIETKQKEQLEEAKILKKAGQVASAVGSNLNSLATLGNIFGIRTDLLRTTVNMGKLVSDLFTAWKDVFKKAKLSNEDKAMLYLFEGDGKKQKLVDQYIFNVVGSDTNPMLGLVPNQNMFGTPVISILDTTGQPIDGNSFLTSLSSAKRNDSVGKALFGDISTKFSIDTITLSRKIEEIFQNYAKEMTLEKILKLTDYRKIQDLIALGGGSIIDWATFQTYIRDFTNKFMG